MIRVSDPQRLTFPEVFIMGHVKWLRDKGVDVHEFATQYVDRTVMLGYPPDLGMCAREFVSQ